ncbi:MAG: branched-chain amino acid ABC transporter permease [Gammaproteobacteria bacterium]|nr:branched-chain amino acid ABC transporter permease [Gammaproteobacteria bacterium]MCI0591464.1 branched-chain amino acid ABC transporter permease [Gammaproteobacteria bacterium]
MEYLLHILVLVGIYTTLSVSLDLLAGYTGLLSIAHAAFYGLGAYTSALLAVNLGAPFLVGVLAGMTVAALVSFVVSLPSLRLHDDYFVIATFGSQMILFSLFNNWIDLTRGPLGIPGIPPPVMFGWTVQSHFEFVLLTAVLAGFTYLVVSSIATSPFGRVLRAIREDEVFAQAMGKNTLYFKVSAFAVSAALAASAGSLYAHYITYIDPTSFTVMESILVISMVIIGGAGSRWGPVIGAVVLVTLPEALRFLGLPIGVAANLRQIIYGILLVLMMMFRPQGLVGRYGFGR